jgi:hypothetical protein
LAVHFFVGGLIAAGFDPSGEYLLTVSHDGRGVFAARGWQRVARDRRPAYPEDGHVIGIGPIDGLPIPVTEMNYDTEELMWLSPDGTLEFVYDSGTITVRPSARPGRRADRPDETGPAAG